VNLAAYHRLNQSLGNPFVYALTRRGFFSEVDCLLNAMIFGLLERRRILVDTSGFGYGWSEFFSAELPTHDEHESSAVAPEWRINGLHTRQAFLDLLAALRDKSLNGVPARVDEIGVDGSIFDLRRRLVSLFCSPRSGRTLAAEGRHVAEESGLAPDRFAAIHVRRGDKVALKMKRGALRREAEPIPLTDYLEAARGSPSPLRHLFLMTDDYAIREELATLDHEFAIVSRCPPDSRGYDQSTFLKLGREERVASIRSLLADVHIAAASSLFVGDLSSNVAQFIVTIHPDPTRCVGIGPNKTLLDGFNYFFLGA
jgi:hypothetical protein